DRHLVGTGFQQAADILHCSYTTADRQRHEAALCSSPHDVEQGTAVLLARRDVEEAKLVGACRIVSSSVLDRIASVNHVHKADALNNAAVLHVETGDDADLKHDSFLARPALQCNVVLRHR